VENEDKWQSIGVKIREIDVEKLSIEGVRNAWGCGWMGEQKLIIA
jgi:hypothetical protein